MPSKIEKQLARIEAEQKKSAVKQNKILKALEIAKKEEDRTEKLEQETLNQENRIEKDEQKELAELKNIESLEENIRKELKSSPLAKVTLRDVTKGIIGAFFGIVSHFAFAEGAHISESYSLFRSICLLIMSFVVIVLFLYYSGFRTVEDKLIFKFLPIRAIVLYLSSIITVVFVLFLYDFVDLTTPITIIFNNVAAISILAALGAGAADLIGKGENA
jgi:uncharacterized membrane protein